MRADDAPLLAAFHDRLRGASTEELADLLGGFAYGKVAAEIVQAMGASARVGFLRVLLATYDVESGERLDAKGATQ
jgi:hypothetical protein